MTIEEGIAVLYESPRGTRVEAEDPKHGTVTLYRTKKGIKATPKFTKIRPVMRMSDVNPQDEPGTGGQL